MTRLQMISLSAYVSLVFLAAGNPAQAQYGAAVVSYNKGGSPDTAYTLDPTRALGAPERFTGEGVFPSAVTPFNPPFGTDELVSVGEGGHLIVKLSNYAIPQLPALGPEIGVFENVGLNDTSYPNGVADVPANAFGVDSALVEVSANGVAWVSLGSVTFNIPTNGYTDLTDPYSTLPGSALSDFQQPFTGTANDFTGKPYAGGASILSLLAGSGGGTWIDISSSGLSQVGFVRFSVPDDFNAASKLRLELDAVSVSHAALGGVVVPEPTAMALIASAASWLAFIRRWKLRAVRQLQ